MKLYSFKEIPSFKENIFIQGNYIHSRKYIHLRNIYSFKFKAICSFKETIFIQQCCVRGHSRNIYSKIVPQPLYGNYKLYNYYLLNKVYLQLFSVEEWRNCWYDRGFCIIITVRVPFAIPSWEEIPLESLPASDTISSPKSDMPASEPFISKGTVEHTSNCEFLLKIYHFPSFWNWVAFIDKTYLYLNALRYLRTNHIRSRLALVWRFGKYTSVWESIYR